MKFPMCNSPKLLRLIVSNIAIFASFFTNLSGQYTVERMKAMLSQRDKELYEIEGIYKVDLRIQKPSIGGKECSYPNLTYTDFDLVAIIYLDGEFKVYSLKRQIFIGRYGVIDGLKKAPHYVYDYRMHDLDKLIARTSSFNRYYFISNTSNYISENYEVLVKIARTGTYESRHFADNELGQNKVTIFDTDKRYEECLKLIDYQYAKNFNYPCPGYTDPFTDLVLSQVNISAIGTKIFPSNDTEVTQNSLSQGTGVVISADGYILTNFHVIASKPKDVWVKELGIWMKDKSYNVSPFPGALIASGVRENLSCVIGGITYALVPVICDADNDLAILKIITPTKKIFQPIIFDTLNSKIGSEIYTIGFPLSSALGTASKYTNGYISSNSELIGYTLNMPINPGNSGGGVFSKNNGSLIGLINARVNDDYVGTKTESISYAIKVNEMVRTLLMHTFTTYTYNHVEKNYDYDVDKQWFKIKISVRNRATKTKSITNNEFSTVIVYAR
jgi:S1-C subfamily serine protease